jgi:hypothetical protein
MSIGRRVLEVPREGVLCAMSLGGLLVKLGNLELSQAR